jgi:hypothetical protein
MGLNGSAIKKLFRLLSIGVIIAVAGVALLPAQIIVVPCPWAPESQKAALGNLTDGIRFLNLPLEGEIVIYTLDGTTVVHIPFNDGTRSAHWFGKTDAGENAASGVYFWVVKSSEGTKTGKLIILR